jgi:hypothetical protein
MRSKFVAIAGHAIVSRLVRLCQSIAAPRLIPLIPGEPALRRLVATSSIAAGLYGYRPRNRPA